MENLTKTITPPAIAESDYLSSPHQAGPRAQTLIRH
jgi:hypothetical protein